MSPGAQGGLRFQSEQFLRGTRDRGGPARPRTEGVRRWCRGTRGQTMELQSRKPGRAWRGAWESEDPVTAVSYCPTKTSAACPVTPGR